MTLPNLIDVAIGLALMFAILATLGSVLAEMWTAHQKWRHKLLRQTVTRLLEPHSAAKFWAHALIRPLYGVVDSPPAGEQTKDAELHERTAQPGLAERMLAYVPKGVITVARMLEPAKAEAPAYLDSKLFATILLDVATGEGAEGRLPATLGAWEYAIRKHVPAEPGENNDLQDRLLAMLRQIPHDSADCGAALHALVVNWYDEAMKGASSLYRRRLQKALFIIGAMLAIVLNCDAIRIAMLLYQNPVLREQVAQQAMIVVGDENSGSVGEAGTTGTPAESVVGTDELKASLKEDLGQLRDLARIGFPIGWLPTWRDNFINKPERADKALRTGPTSDEKQIGGSSAANANTSAAKPKGFLARVGAFFSGIGGWIAGAWTTVAEPGLFAYFAKLCGLLMSALAVCLGAPFWFDLLGRLVKMRSSAGADAEKKRAPGSDDSTDKAAGGKPPAPAPVAGVAPALPPGTDAPIPLPSAIDALTLPTTELDVARAYWLAEFADHAYETDRAELERWLKSNGFSLVEYLDAKGTQGFLAQGEGAAVLAFRGTEQKLEDWVTDGDFKLVDGQHAGSAGQVHKGFAEALGLVTAGLDPLIAKLRARRVLLHLTGHSLGAALATLAAARYGRQSQACPIHTVHTFGSPRVGDAAFVREFDSLFRGRAYRFVNNEDLVTRVPARAQDYDHVCDLVYIDEAGKLQRDIGYWFRFLNFVTNAVGDLKQAVKTTVKDHSMKLYCGHLQKAAVGRRSS